MQDTIDSVHYVSFPEEESDRFDSYCESESQTDTRPAYIDDPTVLRTQSVNKLPQICHELREELIRSVCISGGHFAAGLGVVELTVALHFVFNTPEDQIIWDVGHQSYPHKILTGRTEQMRGIRQHGGLSGFPVRDESTYDAFGVAHAGTSISAGLGMAEAFKHQGSQQRAICVIGDGALTEGMAFEALNHAGASDTDLLVLINDNGMSISPNVGALSESGTGNRNRIKQFVQSLGCKYYGPIDGHDIKELVKQLRHSKKQRGIQVLHLITEKGKGYTPAELDPVAYHAVSPFDPEQGMLPAKRKSRITYTQVFSQWICDTAQDDERIHAITPAMREGSGLVEFEKKFAQRYHDVGIAEQHAVTFAAGLACHHQKPVVAIYSSFLQRAYDQFVHDVALQNLDVTFAIDRSGIVGADGATHHGSFDLSFLRCIPNLVLMTPANERECRQMLQTALEYEGPAAVRYERGAGPGTKPLKTLETLDIGKASIERRGNRIALLAFGGLLQPASVAAVELGATLVNMRFIKPVDEGLLKQLADSHDVLITLENNAIAGGAGSAVNEALNHLHITTQVLNLGLPDNFIQHGSQKELLAECQLDAEGIVKQVKRYQRKNGLALVK